MSDEIPPNAELGLPEGVPPQPDDFESVPYEYNPQIETWVAIDVTRG